MKNDEGKHNLKASYISFCLRSLFMQLTVILCVLGTFSVPLDVVGSAAFNALMKFDSYISQISPKKRHLEVINFVNIDKTVTEYLIGVFTMHLRDISRHVTPANGIQTNSSPDTSVASDDDSSSQPKALQMSSPRNKCCVCGKQETGKHILTDRPSCSHRCCTGCRSRPCNKCRLLAPGVARSRNIAEPQISSNVVSSRVQNRDVDTNNAAASPLAMSRPRSNSISFSKTTTTTTDSGKTNPDSSNSKSEKKDRVDNEFTPGPVRRRSSSLNRDDRERHSEKCVICMDTMTNPKKLDCGHVFCAECIEAAFAHAAKCPCCGRIFGKLKGNQPTGGTMKIQRSVDDLAGYKGAGSFVIKYEIPNGFQQVELCDLRFTIPFQFSICCTFPPFQVAYCTLFEVSNSVNK